MYPWVDTDTSKIRGRRAVLAAAASVLMTAAFWPLASAKAAGDPPPHGAADDGPKFVDVDWLMVQARQDDGRRRSISLLLTLEVAEATDVALVARKLRQLREAYLLTLSSPPLIKTGRDRVDPAEVKLRVAKANRHVLGDHVVDEVLLRDISDFGAK